MMLPAMNLTQQVKAPDTYQVGCQRLRLTHTVQKGLMTSVNHVVNLVTFQVCIT